MYRILVKFILNRYVLGFLAAAATAIGVYVWGYGNNQDDQEKRDLEVYKKTLERINETPVNTNLDAAIERLRKNGDLR